MNQRLIEGLTGAAAVAVCLVIIVIAGWWWEKRQLDLTLREIRNLK